jgi:succinate dehydrogenase / fumarate reductase cytochrome b subunit
VFLQFCTSTVGKKYLMGISGLIWTGFVAAHMAGNLLIFISPDAYNSYGHALTSGSIIYFAEGLLVFALATHIFLALNLTVKNRSARPGGYAVAAAAPKKASFGSTTMAVHGTIILVFIILHLITFKYGTHYETTVNGVVMRDLSRLMFEVFAQPGYVAWYLVALVLLGFHLRHGVSSVFQSFGLLHPSYQKGIKCLGVLYAVVVAGGFIAQPVYIFLVK